jgi:IS30 family transposase
MAYPKMPREVRRAFWVQVRAGVRVPDAAVAVGVSTRLGWSWFSQAGGVAPCGAPGSGRQLCFAEREELALLRAGGYSMRGCARRMGRAPSTISRELARGSGVDGTYRASGAQAGADRAAARPKPAKLAGNDRLREQVQSWLLEKFSPAQVAARLRVKFPDQPEMWVSHEPIYQALFVQGRGALRRELTACLRTGRAVRKPRRPAGPGQRRGRIPGMVNISQRPPEIADRAVPGHWEGDLILGKDNTSAIGTLVERATGFVLLLHLPDRHGALEVEHEMITAMARLPATLRKTLTWDQGTEMTNHVSIAAATELEIYFCDPHSPWQRGSNENTNGLLRQYFPKGTDLSGYHRDYLDFVANQLNNRPRKRHGFQTPAEVLDALLSNQTDDPPSVATTA